MRHDPRLGRSRRPYRRPRDPAYALRKFLVDLGVAGAAVLVLGWALAPERTPRPDTQAPPPQRIVQTEQSTYYPNCATARAAGAAPIHEGSPGYREGLDGDGDGIACEPYRGW